MFCYLCTLLFAVLFLLIPFSSVQASELCINATEEIGRQPHAPEYCNGYLARLTTEYRIDFAESDVDKVCESDSCQSLLGRVGLACITYAKKDLNCLDTPGVVHVWCGTSDIYNNSCYSSLTTQGVISTPYLLMSCLNSIYNDEICSDECRNLLMSADCCFASYYAFMIDAFVGDDGSPVFENQTSFLDEFWEWCDLTSPGVCPGLSLTDFSERNNNVTCEGPSTNTDGTGSTDDPMSTDSPERNPDGAIIREPPLVGFYILLTFTVLIILIGI